MFCVLSVTKRNRTAFEKLFGRFMTDEYTVNTVSVGGGAPFFTLEIVTNKNETDWENVILSVGKCAGRLVVGDDMFVPELSGIGVFRNDALYKRMMGNTFVQILERNKIKPCTISVCDKNGENTELVKCVSRFASQLVISTESKEKYCQVCDDITDEIGLCPIVKSCFDDGKIKINANKSVMTVQCENENINICDGIDFNVPEDYKTLLPEGIDEYDFCSALYELCGVFSLGALNFDTIIVNNEKKRVEDIHFS